MHPKFRYASLKLLEPFTTIFSFTAKNETWSSSSPISQQTSFLDGMRGIAALIVAFYHTAWAYSSAVEKGYGYNGENYSFIQLPFIRLIYAGHAMVCIFFVIGGYVNALRPLHIAHYEKQWDKLFTLISSSLLRRSIRLYIPPVFATFLSAITLRLGWWEASRAAIDAGMFVGWPDLHPPRQPTMSAQLADWWHHTAGLFNLWTYMTSSGTQPYYNIYDPHLWTVPYEVRTSVILMLVLVIVARCRPLARWLLLLAFIQFSASWGRWEVVMFLSGAMLADIKMYRDIHNESLPTQTEKDDNLSSTICRPQKAAVTAIVLFTGLYLLSAPSTHIDGTPGYTTIASIIPESYGDKRRIIHGAGAIMLVWATSSSLALQQLFLTGIAQYLGRISYALYIVHGPLLHIVGYAITPAIWKYLCSDGNSMMQRIVAVGLGNAITFGVIFLVAKCFYIWVDTTSVRISRAAEQLCFGQS